MNEDLSRLLVSISVVFAGIGIVGVLTYGGARAEIGSVGVQRLIAAGGMLLAAVWLLLLAHYIKR